MKIFLVFNSIQFLIRFKLDFVRELALSNKIFLLFPHDKNVIDSLEINAIIYNTPLISRGRNPLTDLMFLFKLNTMIKEIQPDLVLSFTIKPNIYAGFVSKFYRVPHIMTISGLGSAYHLNLVPKWVYFSMYSLAVGKRTFAMFENDNIENVFKQRRIKFFDTQTIKGSGVDLVRFSFQDLPITKPLRFLYIGRLMYEKGIFELINATKSLQLQGYKFELQLVGEVTGEIKRFIEDIKLDINQDWIRFDGFINDVSIAIRNAHAIIHPSHHEGMSNALLEAAACGRPLIASNIPGCKEIVDHNVNGYLFEPNNQLELENSILKMINLDLNQLIKMGKSSREKVELLFDRKLIDYAFLHFIKKISSGVRQ